MLFVGGMTAIAAGIFCFTDTEMAWRLYELDNQMWGKFIKQPKNWRDQVRYMGVILILLGAMAFVAGFDLL